MEPVKFVVVVVVVVGWWWLWDGGCLKQGLTLSHSSLCTLVILGLQSARVPGVCPYIWLANTFVTQTFLTSQE